MPYVQLYPDTLRAANFQGSTLGYPGLPDGTPLGSLTVLMDGAWQSSIGVTSFTLGTPGTGEAGENPRFYLTNAQTGSWGRVPSIASGIPAGARLKNLVATVVGYYDLITPGDGSYDSGIGTQMWLSVYETGAYAGAGQVWVANPWMSGTPYGMTSSGSTVSIPLADASAAAADYLEVAVFADKNYEIAETVFFLWYATAPTTTVTGPPTTVATSRPGVTWTHTAGTDGGPQSKYRVLIYTQAQTVAGGFAVGVTTPIWDSGIVADPNATGVVVGTDLTNSTTYVAYVQTAQVLNGDHWAAWASKTFTVSVAAPVAPDAPMLRITPAPTRGRIDLQVYQKAPVLNAWYRIVVEKSTDGLTWTALRGGTLNVTSGQVIGISDYEVANGARVIYRVRAWASSTVGGIWQESASSYTSLMGQWVSTDTWLIDPLDPNNNLKIDIVTLPAVARKVVRGVFDIAGRTNPVVLSDARHTGEATITFVTHTTAAARKMRALMATGRVLYLNGAAGDDVTSGYIALGDANETRASRLAAVQDRFWQATYVTVDAPVGDAAVFITGQWSTIPLGWDTWVTFSLAYESWAEVITNGPG